MLRRLTRLSAVVLGTSLACRINRERLAYAMDRDDEKAAAVDANGNPINLILEPERIAEGTPPYFVPPLYVRTYATTCPEGRDL